MILVSACLAGRPCRYDGRLSPSPELISFLKGRRWFAVCPEQLGGLATPRPPARLSGGDGLDVLRGRALVIDARGENVTLAFQTGAEITLALARRLGATACYLKDRSPSCGVNAFFDDDGRPRGQGVTAALLQLAGLELLEVKAKSLGVKR
ncbi:MAG: DUF523 domain-containing protein [Pseudomonadota bacterium]